MGTRQPTNRTPLQSREWPIEQLPGLNQQNQLQLQQCGITTTGELLRTTGSADQRQALATQLHIHIQYVNKWVALADLARIPSVGCQYCGLLLHAGIGSVVQLAKTPAHRLHQQILRLQVSTLQRRDLCPAVEEVQKWVEQARAINN